MDIDQRPTGYPAFHVVRHNVLRMTPARLMTLAEEKMTGIQFFTAVFDGERHFFEPWISAFVHMGSTAATTAVYCVGDPAEVSATEPSVCVLRLLWDKKTDLRQAQDAYDANGPEGFRDYLADGPQISTTMSFGSGSSHADALSATEALVSRLQSGLRLAPTEREWKRGDWERLRFHSSDVRLLATVDYAAGSMCSPEIDEALPSWLAQLAEISERPGMTPDDKPLVSVDPSIPEALSGTVKTTSYRLI